MLDPTPYLEVLPGPRGLFDQLDQRADWVRFQVSTPAGWQPITFGEFAAEVRNVACWLHSVGHPAEGRAAVFAPNRVEWLSAAFGVQSAGGAMVPIYASSTAEQAGYVIEHSDATVLFVDTAPLLERVFRAWPQCSQVRHIVLLDDSLDATPLLERLHTEGAPCPSPSEFAERLRQWSQIIAAGARWQLANPTEFSARLHAIQLDHVGLMLYTSGTSGNPKGVPLTHRNVGVNGADWMRNFHPLVEERDHDLLWLPFSHVFGFGEAGIGNTLGWTSWLASPAEVMNRLPEVRPHVLMSVPAYWEKIAVTAQAQAQATGAHPTLTLQDITGGRLRFCLSGGAGLKVDVKEWLHAHGILIMEGYGLTECSPTLTLNSPSDFRFDTVGKPLPSVNLRLAEDGEILAKGPSIFRGYHKLPEATAEAFEDGWFKTGDVGRFTEDGFLQIVDRKKDILVTAGGKNIPPANIERLFQDDPFVAHAVVYGEGKRYLTVGIWLDTCAVEQALGTSSPEDPRVQALCAERVMHANGQLAHHETLKKFKIFAEPLTVEGGLLTPTLKVKRKAVWARYERHFEDLYA